MNKITISITLFLCVFFFGKKATCQENFPKGIVCILRASNPTHEDSKKSDSNSMIEIYNMDNSIYFSSPKYSDNYNIPKDFSPYALDLAENVLILKVIDMDDDFYIVKSNKRELKKVRKDNPSLMYLSMENFIIKYDMTISFNHKLNPLRKNYGKSTVLKNLSIDYKEAVFNPIEIKGNWLKIGYIQFDREKEEYGWIKWRDKKGLLITFNLFE